MCLLSGALVVLYSAHGALAQAEPHAAQIYGAQADETPSDLAALFARLADPNETAWRRIERQIMREWSRSGSDAIDYLFERGQAALKAGDPETAIGHFSACIDHAPAFAEAWHARASAFFMMGRLGEAMADLEEVLAREPRHFSALAGLGAILEQIGALEAARAAYAQSLALNPHRQTVRDALARVELALRGLAL